MTAMNDFADHHVPTYFAKALLFKTKPELARWQELNATLLRDSEQLLVKLSYRFEV